MINFLHSFTPNPILISFGPFHIYWYGLFIVLGIISAVGIALKLSSYYKVNKDYLIDIAFWSIIFGILGARFYHVLLELEYYKFYPLDALKIWQGGIAIHGALIAGLITVYFLSKKYKINFWLFTAIASPGIALAQSIGRWGNYFNQELFGKPSDLPWSIPIDLPHRVDQYYNYHYFHPTFLYESIGNFIIFLILIFFHYLLIKKQKFNNFYYSSITLFYISAYSILRFFMEFIRIDNTPSCCSLRFPQIASLILFAFAVGTYLMFFKKHKQEKKIKID